MILDVEVEESEHANADEEVMAGDDFGNSPIKLNEESDNT
jgi:hypothetical protein